MNENLEYLRRSAVYLLSAVCLLFTKKAAYDASNTKISQSKDVWNENLEFLRWSAVWLLSAVCLLFIKKAAYDASNTKTSQSKDVWNEI